MPQVCKGFARLEPLFGRYPQSKTEPDDVNMIPLTQLNIPSDDFQKKIPSSARTTRTSGTHYELMSNLEDLKSIFGWCLPSTEEVLATCKFTRRKTGSSYIRPKFISMPSETPRKGSKSSKSASTKSSRLKCSESLTSSKAENIKPKTSMTEGMLFKTMMNAEQRRKLKQDSVRKKAQSIKKDWLHTPFPENERSTQQEKLSLVALNPEKSKTSFSLERHHRSSSLRLSSPERSSFYTQDEGGRKRFMEELSHRRRSSPTIYKKESTKEPIAYEMMTLKMMRQEELLNPLIKRYGSSSTRSLQSESVKEEEETVSNLEEGGRRWSLKEAFASPAPFEQSKRDSLSTTTNRSENAYDHKTNSNTNREDRLRDPETCNAFLEESCVDSDSDNDKSEKYIKDLKNCREEFEDFHNNVECYEEDRENLADSENCHKNVEFYRDNSKNCQEHLECYSDNFTSCREDSEFYRDNSKNCLKNSAFHPQCSENCRENLPDNKRNNNFLREYSENHPCNSEEYLDNSRVFSQTSGEEMENHVENEKRLRENTKCYGVSRDNSHDERESWKKYLEPLENCFEITEENSEHRQEYRGSPEPMSEKSDDSDSSWRLQGR